MEFQRRFGVPSEGVLTVELLSAPPPSPAPPPPELEPASPLLQLEVGPGWARPAVLARLPPRLSKPNSTEDRVADCRTGELVAGLGLTGPALHLTGAGAGLVGQATARLCARAKQLQVRVVTEQRCGARLESCSQVDSEAQCRASCHALTRQPCKWTRSPAPARPAHTYSACTPQPATCPVSITVQKAL